MPKLHDEGLVQPQIGPQLTDLLRSCILAQQKNNRISHELKQQERKKRYCDHHDHSLDQAAQNKSKHSVEAHRSGSEEQMLSEQGTCPKRGERH
ncbi:hypothetical protein J2W36_002834 [Variovorax ginsengisoli]|uniref:Uncharacterized protein n=1 Tax=Variovorax ginsengisoli TaxID=363844 RepID=A0ABT9S887_9BURK|nr:hypothetical protein [Variovorax ginsengisoli]